MGLREFPAPKASFSTTFLQNCGRCINLLNTTNTTCLKNVVRRKQGQVSSKILSLQQVLFLKTVEFHGDHTKMR